jgi:hypothetical protein
VLKCNKLLSVILYNKDFVSAVVYSHPVTLAPAVQNTVYEFAHLLGRYVETGREVWFSYVATCMHFHSRL